MTKLDKATLDAMPAKYVFAPGFFHPALIV